MSENNINDIFVDDEDIEEESKEDDEEWGGNGTNEIIVPQVAAIAALLSMGYNPTHTNESIPITERRVRRREEELPQIANKVLKNAEGKRIVRKRTSLYSYLCLKSGEEFHFKEEDGKNILLNECIESNRLIRNIISIIPVRVSERLNFLAKFESDEESDEENDEKVQRRYLGNLKELVYEAYIKEWRLRFQFKRLLVLWRTYYMNKSSEKELDPITLSEPEKEIHIYDWSNKKKFIFDAKSMATMIESKLLYQEYGFAVPMYPKNPKNNVEFSYKQMVSLYNQLKSYGELRWGFTTLREFDFKKNRWHMYHRSALTIYAIKYNLSQLDNADGRDMLLDFIFAKMEEIGINYTTNTYNIYKAAMCKVPNHWYLEKLKALAISHYEGEHFGQNRTRIINTACNKIFRKQNRFFLDLKNANIIR